MPVAQAAQQPSPALPAVQPIPIFSSLRTVFPSTFMAFWRNILISLVTGFFLAGTVACAETPAVQEVRLADDLPATEAEVSPPVDIWDRIRRGYAMPELKSSRVRTALRSYTRNPRHIERVFERAGRYLYHIVDEIEQRGLPTELALLPFVESAFQPEALSHAKAAGLWQFMPQTGNIYSLEQNFWKDERRDVLQSTRAALDYLEKLHNQFGDWQLALAAYNWGEGSVQRAIWRAKARGSKTDYTHLRMPRETANYVPRLEAIRQIVAEPEKYGINLPNIENEPYFVRVTKSRDIDMKTAAELAEMDLDEFRLLNPGFNLPVIVASHDSVILLPMENLEVFMDNLASWVNTGKPLSSWVLYHLKDGETLSDVAAKSGMTEEELRRVNRIPKGRRVLPGSALLVDANGQLAPEIAKEEFNASLKLSAPETRRVVYRVRRGDSIYSIAKKYGITQRSIRKTNRLKSSQLRIGQRLVLVIPPRAATQPAPGKNVHVVRRGETLFSIAKKYRTSVSKIRIINNLRTTRLSIGQRLKIR